MSTFETVQYIRGIPCVHRGVEYIRGIYVRIYILYIYIYIYDSCEG